MSNVKQDIAREIETRAWEMRTVKRWSQAKIAEELNISQSTVSRALSRVSSRTARELSKKVEHQKSQQTASLEHIAAEALKAWEDSKKDSANKERGGYIGYLDTAMKALADIRKIWGAEAPTKADVTSDGRPIKTYVSISPDDWDADEPK